MYFFKKANLSLIWKFSNFPNMIEGNVLVIVGSYECHWWYPEFIQTPTFVTYHRPVASMPHCEVSQECCSVSAKDSLLMNSCTLLPAKSVLGGRGGHSLNAFSEPRPSRTLELVEASKSWLKILLVVIYTNWNLTSTTKQGSRVSC